MRSSNEVFRELETVNGELAMAKRMGEDINYIYSLELTRERLRNEYDNINQNVSSRPPEED